MSEIETPRRWYVPDKTRLLWKSWNDHPTDPLALVYHRDSDNTHLLNALGAAIVRLLEERPYSRDETIQALSETFPDLAGQPLQVERFLHQLTLAGILEICS